MKKKSVEAIIYSKDLLNIKYAVCHLTQTHYEDGTFEYVFKPYYQVIELLSPDTFQGIPGLNLDLKQDIYVRENKVPTFIYERVPQENREDLWEFLDEAGLAYMDPLEWLIKTDYQYTGDNLVVYQYMEQDNKPSINNIYPGQSYKFDSVTDISRTNYQRLKILLEIIVKAANLKAGAFYIDESNRKSIYALIYPLFQAEYNKRRKKQENGINSAKKLNKYRGRKKVEVSIPLLAEIIEKLEEKEMTVDDAMNKLGIRSRSTFYRRVKEFKEEK
jgi:hypothetical protein